MTPPAAAAPARVRTPLRTPPPRRVSGPVRRPAPAGGAVVVPLPLPVRAAGAARRLPDLPLLDRLVRGRLWIAIIAFALFGIVFMQVSLLKLNAGISRDVATIERLDRETSLLRADVARLGGPDRVGATAVRLGMTAPVAGSVAFAGARTDAAKVAATLTAPDPIAWQEGLAADLQRAGVVTPTPQASDAPVAPSTPQASDASVAPGTPQASDASVAPGTPQASDASGASAPAAQPVAPQATPTAATAGGAAAPEG